MVRFFHYKPVGLIQSKWKSVAESRLQGPSSSGLLLPQAILSIARASVVPSIVAGVELLLRTCILPSYPQGWDRFTSPSVCKLFVDATVYKPRKGKGFIYTNNITSIYRHQPSSWHGPFWHLGLSIHSDIQENTSHPGGTRTPSPCTSTAHR